MILINKQKLLNWQLTRIKIHPPRGFYFLVLPLNAEPNPDYEYYRMTTLHEAITKLGDKHIANDLINGEINPHEVVRVYVAPYYDASKP